MDPDSASQGRHREVDELLRALGRVPAFARDRHLTVSASNASARALSPALVPGLNLAAFVFLSGDGACAFAEELRAEVVAILRDSLHQHDQDEAFRALLGELEVKSPGFATLWADERHPAAHGGRIAGTGRRALYFQELRLVDDYDSTVVVLSSRAPG